MHGVTTGKKSLEIFVVLLTKYMYLFIYTHNGDGTFQGPLESWNPPSILSNGTIWLETAHVHLLRWLGVNGTVHFLCLTLHLKTNNYLCLHSGSWTKFLSLSRYSCFPVW